MTRRFDFEFRLSEPITREEFDAWREREGIADEDDVPLELVLSGEFIAFRGAYTATGADFLKYLPRFRDWMTARGIVISYLRGDFCPPGFGRANPLAEM